MFKKTRHRLDLFIRIIIVDNDHSNKDYGTPWNGVIQK